MVDNCRRRKFGMCHISKITFDVNLVLRRALCEKQLTYYTNLYIESESVQSALESKSWLQTQDLHGSCNYKK